MAEFEIAFKLTNKIEGGYKLHKVKDDKGGWTFAGISRKYNPQWVGWKFIDKGDFKKATELVPDFYLKTRWMPIKGYQIKSQEIANKIYDFAVNSHVRISVRLAQLSCKEYPDGLVGVKTLKSINNIDEELFLLRFTLARVARRVKVVGEDRTQEKFLLGWLRRDLGVS